MNRPDAQRADDNPHETPAEISPAEVSRIELQIPASSEWVRVARLTVAGVASRLPFPVDAVEDIKLAVTEAINNAIQHAPSQTLAGQEATISIVIKTSARGLWIDVADQGRLHGGWPASDLNAQAARPDELPEGGLGLMLIRSLMDEVEHQSGPTRDTVVSMFKRVPNRGTPSAPRRPPVAC